MYQRLSQEENFDATLEMSVGRNKCWTRRCTSRRCLYKWLALLLGMYLVDYLGLLKHLFELSYTHYYSYPLEDDDAVRRYASQMRQHGKAELQPLNFFNYSFLQNPNKCQQSEPARLTMLIKSALGNHEKRAAIRRSWGYENRFSDTVIRRVFLLGVPDNNNKQLAQLEQNIAKEAAQFGDLVQANFIDSYFNNTLKTMMGFSWAVQHCANSAHYLFVDDDYYVSIKNMLRFIAEATNKEQLYAGYVIQSAPHRHKLSKWYVPLQEYPYDLWPPYVTAGAFVLAQQTLQRMYFVSLYTKLFRFDDIYLSMVALKADVLLTHSAQFYFERAHYSAAKSYKNVLASHGFDDAQEMERIWNECRSAGLA